MIDRTGQVWETAGGDVWLVTATSLASERDTRHDIVILYSRVESLVGRSSWRFERQEGADGPSWLFPWDHSEKMTRIT